MSRRDIAPPSEPLLECPTCLLPAEITDRFTLDSSDGPVEHLKLVCVRRHWCTLPVDFLQLVARTAPVPGRRVETTASE